MTLYRHRLRRIILGTVLGLGLLAATASWMAAAQVTLVTPPGRTPPKIDATVQMTGKFVALGVGYGWGRGVVTYDGVEQAFCIHGFSVGNVGVVRMRADGLVFHLQSLDDFSGKYLALSTGVAIAGGESAAVLKNEHGVTIQLETKLRGLSVSLAGSRLRITLAGSAGCTGES